ncbi:MAG: cysteine desulfurase family protein [Pyrinomonadaceae bacterium]
MAVRSVYLDNNATTRVAPEVVSAMIPFLEDNFGNPSSAHAESVTPETAIAEARKSVAEFLGASRESQIIFTSGGTESDNWAVLGAAKAGEGKKILMSSVEHEAVRNAAKRLENDGFEVVAIGVNSKGGLDFERLEQELDRETVLVSIMMANNETGVVFPIDRIGEMVKKKSNALFHVDGVNAAGKIPIELDSGPIDLFSISAHKFHGPKGVGALYIREGIALSPMVVGGGQESSMRAGTEAVHQIVGLGTAARLANDLAPMEKVQAIRDRFEKSVLNEFSIASVNGAGEKRLPNTSNISFEGLNGELILHGLDRAGIRVSTGSACNANDKKVSPVLKAMDIPFERALGSVRFSFGRFNTMEDVDVVLEALRRVIGKLSRISGLGETSKGLSA